MESDFLHAQFFAKQNCRDYSTAAAKEYRSTNNVLARFYQGGQECHFAVKTEKNRTFLEYDCPLLGYRELAFPIFVEETVVGVFITGQLTLDRQEEFIKQRILSLPDRLGEAFKTELRGSPRKKLEDFAPEILECHEKWLNRGKKEEKAHPQTCHVLTKDKYDKLIVNVCREMDGLETVLDQELKAQRTRYIGRRISPVLKRLSRRVVGNPELTSPTDPFEQHKQNQQALDRLWYGVEVSMKLFCRRFCFRYALVFGTRQAGQETQQNLKVAAKAGRWEKVLTPQEAEKLEYPLDHAPDRYYVYGPDSQEFKALRGIQTSRLGDCQFIFVPVPFYPQSSIAFLVGYHPVHSRLQPENLPNSELDMALQSFNTLVVSLLSAILARKAELRAVDQLRYLGHEVVQLCVGINSYRYRFFETPERLQNLDNKIRADLCADFISFTRQIQVHFEMARMLSHGLPPDLKLESINPHGDLLLKWRTMYRAEAKNKKLQIPHYLQGVQDPKRPAIVAYRDLFEALVYNLINNAVKYCHRGTKVHLDCVVHKAEGKPGFLLTVADYGREMNLAPKMYQLYGRGVADVDGLGIGLYLAQRIVDAHKGSIKHTCEPISPLNVALLEACVSKKGNLVDATTRQRAKDELDRLQMEGIYSDIVARDQEGLLFKPYPETVLAEIAKPTYRVTAHVFIPRWENMIL